MKKMLFNNEKAFELHNKVYETAKEVIDCKKEEIAIKIKDLDKAIDEHNEYFKYYE
jgi:predicted AlkP superfamily phosphohydrolase/phosphomutase